jgi:signal transduction histidine kinase/ligand-binding sensor domain-containing protein/CheY-like chemotaxis protein
MLKVFFIIFTIHLSLPCRAVIDNFNFFGEKSGLSTLNIRSITEDKTGYLWVGTINGVFKFNGNVFNKVNISDEANNYIVNYIYTDSLNSIWVGTKNNGLFKNQNNDWTIINLSNKYYNNQIPSILSILENDNKVWIATNKGLSYFDSNNNLFNIESLKGIHIGSIEFINSQEILIGSNEKLLIYSLKTDSFSSYDIPLFEKAMVHSTLNILNRVWVATSKGLIFFNLETKKYSHGPTEIQNTRTLNVLQEQNDIWISTVEKGLFYIEDGKDIRNIKYLKNQGSLSDKYIRTIYISKNKDLWVGNFFNGINHLDLNLIDFKYETSQEKSLYCTESAAIYNILISSDSLVWLSASTGLILFNKKTQECTLLNEPESPYVVYSVTKSHHGLWLSTSKGLKHIDESNLEIKNTVFNDVVYFSFADENGNNYIVTDAGLFEYIETTREVKKIPHSKSIVIKSYQKDSNGKVYLLTSQGICTFENGLLEIFDTSQHIKETSNIGSFHINSNDKFFIGTHDQRLVILDKNQKLIKTFNLRNNVISGFKINSILSEENENIIWTGTDKGLIRFDLLLNKSNVFKNIAGNSTNQYLPNSIYNNKNIEMFFGTSTGFVYFNPKDVYINETPPTVVINSMKLLNKKVEVNKIYPSGFILNDEINNLNEIEIGHLDYIIGFEFSALDFANLNDNKFLYRLSGLEKDWVSIDSNNPQATYSNLNPGDYVFEVKATNSYGVWTKSPKQLKIKVLPAPWKTWWAYTLYVLTLISLICWYIQRKNRENIRITKMLKAQVKERTAELEVQKKTVENLLVRKNEMFANVSHEFRTPLTLILGPVNKLLNSRLHSEDIQSLKMVNRNANRLLTMIEQLLLLAKISGEEKVHQIPQLVNHQILSIIEIFQPLAKQRGIKLTLVNNNKAAINAVPNTIDTILGNLISNAIKYTPTGGEVWVNSYTSQGKVIIEVKDTGCGLDEQQKIDIFNRFKRLDSHANIDGVGIGLSVVEEMLKINKATIEIESEPGSGSLFRVIFTSIDPADIKVVEEDKHLLVNQLAKNTGLQVDNNQVLVESTGNKNNETILIIEDNDDMRLHISNSIKSNFHCLLADRGKKGIALAVKHVPDIIICDVMMPEMDGFKVSRILRSDTRTSHIPLILLTALHDKESRIKGWREHIDAYLTKPFDSQELLLQLENILVIRNILKSKAGKIIQAGRKTSKGSGLPKRDKAFVDKMNDLIAKNYSNPIYQRVQLASDMAVSEKQLQRKLKALIDKNPMELLREYRLQKAAEKLKDGLQVSLTCDESGFNSVSHFSQCFKAHYGVSPKVYQQNCKKV